MLDLANFRLVRLLVMIIAILGGLLTMYASGSIWNAFMAWGETLDFQERSYIYIAFILTIMGSIVLGNLLRKKEK